jgi:hypothetical protein
MSAAARSPSGRGEVADEPVAVRSGRVGQEVQEHERALAFTQVPEQLLAVGIIGADEVEQVVPDLERDSEEEAEPAQGTQRGRPPRADERAHPQGETVVYQHFFLPVRLT